MIPNRPQQGGGEVPLEGWPRDLGLRPVEGVDRTDKPGDEVREAIRVERQVQSSVVPARVDSVRLLEQREGLWEAQITLGRQRGRAPDWRGASLVADLAHGGAVWTAELLDLQGTRAVLCAPPPVEPQPGRVDLRPFDFLRAPWALVQAASLRPAFDRFVELLEATAGWRRGRPGVRGQIDPWGWSWAAVWGPPGTGKTYTLVKRVLELLQRPDERVLVLSTTNRATDEIALRLARDAPEGVLRVGRAQVQPYRAQGATHVLPQPPERLDLLVAAEQRLAYAATGSQRARARRQLNEVQRSLPTLADLLAEARPRCVVTTLHAALSAVVHEHCGVFHEHDRAPFTTVILDEAGLVSRASVAAAALLAARQVVLVGDPRQLSPICVASRSLEPRVKRWLASSALEHVRAGDDHVQALRVQHRMHPDVRAVVSALSYEGRLDDADALRERGWPGGARLAQLPRAIWLVLDRFPEASAGAAAERGEEGSWIRRESLTAFDDLLRGYDELKRSEGLFLTPYRAQAARAARLTSQAQAPWRASTIHAQQGAQAPVVFFDIVRGTGWPPPEFRRLVNVALSRAQHLVVFCATQAEMGAGWLAPIRGMLPRFVVRHGQLERLQEDRQEGLFGPPRPQPRRVEVDAEPAAPQGGRGARHLGTPPPAGLQAEPPSPRGSGLDPARLGVQIAQHRAARRTLTRAQAQLVERNLKDLGPRVVRGVAGSGKTIVLARWAAAELITYPERRATVLFGNLSLEPHLDELLRSAWRVTSDGAPYPEDRVELLHVGRLLQRILDESGLPRPAQPWDLQAHVAALAATEVAGPRFDLLYIDEAQDLGHDVLAFLLAQVDRAGGHFPARLFYDNAQNVYGRSTPRWTDFGLDVRGRSTVLRESFRATRQGMELALNVVHRLKPLDGDPDLREFIRSGKRRPLLVDDGGWWRAEFAVVSGERPRVELFDDRGAEGAALVEAVQGWIVDSVRPQDIRVLALSREACVDVAAALVDAGVDAVCRFGRDFLPHEARVVVTTAHCFKGYEAELVAVVGLEAFATAELGPLVEVLYVALTRARTRMRVSACRVPPHHPGATVIHALQRARTLQLERG